jgi:Nickel responsive protein SCO4226-like
MALYMDIHRQVEGLTREAAAEAHARDLDVQAKYGVKYLRYWYDEGTSTVFASARLRAKQPLKRCIARPVGWLQMRSSRSRKAHRAE